MRFLLIRMSCEIHHSRLYPSCSTITARTLDPSSPPAQIKRRGNCETVASLEVCNCDTKLPFLSLIGPFEYLRTRIHFMQLSRVINRLSTYVQEGFPTRFGTSPSVAFSFTLCFLLALICSHSRRVSLTDVCGMVMRETLVPRPAARGRPRRLLAWPAWGRCVEWPDPSKSRNCSTFFVG